LTGDTLVFEENFDWFDNFGRIDIITLVTVIMSDPHHHTIIIAIASPFSFDSNQTLAPLTKVKTITTDANPSRHFQILN
jgi:hypothetical protein